jgi:sulfatase maturation enzyme AslB (radical SAM superfamily)
MLGKNSTLKTEDGNKIIKKEETVNGLLSPNLPSNAIICVVGYHCNLRCRYCFHSMKDQESKQIMNVELLEKFTKEFLKLPLEPLVGMVESHYWLV